MEVIVQGLELNQLYDFFNAWGMRLVTIAIGLVCAYVIHNVFKRLGGIL